MGDSDNAIPFSRKRTALKELSRDNPGLDDDDEDTSALESGTFNTASKEVLASRRIIRVRRTDRSATAPPASNPFTGIRLVPLLLLLLLLLLQKRLNLCLRENKRHWLMEGLMLPRKLMVTVKKRVTQLML